MKSEISDHALFVHGAGGGSWEWCVWTEVFEQHNFKTYAINLENSEKDASNTESSHYLSQLIEYSRKNQLNTPVLVGAGMGGLLVLRACELLKPSALVLVNPLGSETFKRPINEMDFTPVIFNNMAPEDEPNNGKTRPDTSAKAHFLSDEAEFPEINCPCYLLIGEQSDVIPPETGNELAAKLNAEVTSFDGTSHIDALLGIEAKAIARHICQNLTSL